MYVCVPLRPEEGVGSTGAGVTDRCEPPGGCWELNLDPLGEEPVLLPTKPTPFSFLRLYNKYSLPSFCFVFCFCFCLLFASSVWLLP